MIGSPSFWLFPGKPGCHDQQFLHSNSLFGGSLISMRLVSKMMPRKDRDVEGLSNLSVAKGTPYSTHNDRNKLTLFWHTVEAGGPIVR